MADIKTNINDQENEKQRDAKDPSNEKSSTKEDANWQLQKSLSESLLYLYENKLWTDVSFRCKDHDDGDLSDRIRAHRNILAARSPVFQAMFYGPCANRKEEQELLTVEAEVLHLAVRYMYSEETDLTEDLAPKVMEIGHMYQISGLVNYCAEYLDSVLRHDNACEILELALLYDLEKLRDSACTVIDRNASKIIQSESLLQLSVSCLTYILKGDLFFEEEQKIVEAASRWAQHNLKISSTPVSGKTYEKY